MEMIDIYNMTFMEIVRSTYPVSFIVMILSGFGAALAGFATRARFKNQDKLIKSLETEVERLSS